MVESSSVFTGSTNGLYPVRDLKIFKKSNKGIVYFEVPGLEEYGENYQMAYDISMFDLAKVYGIFQKFCGQSISADFYQSLVDGNKVSMTDLYKLIFLCDKIGMKTWYYLNTKTSEDKTVAPAPESYQTVQQSQTSDEDEEKCDSCTL